MIINYKFIGDYKDPERKDVEYEHVDNTIQIILPIESILNEDHVINSDGVIEYKKRRCSCCSSKNIHKKRLYMDHYIFRKRKVIKS